jgi:integrase
MANRKVSLWKYVRIDAKWRYCKPVVGKNNKVKPHWVIVKGTPEEHPEGNYYLHYYEGQREVWRKLGNDAASASRQLDYEQHVKTAEAAGVKVERENKKLPLSVAITGYLAEVKLTTRPESYDLHQKTLKDFAYFCKREYVEDITRLDCLQFREFLARAFDNSPRTCGNKLLRVNQFIRRVLKLGNGKGPISVKDTRLGVVETEPEVYTQEELQKFISACTGQDRLIFLTLLQAGLREDELKFLYWEDVDFIHGTLKVRAKPEYDFLIKDHEERTVTVPMSLTEALREHKKNNPHRLVFATRSGLPNTHLLELCKRIANRAKVHCTHDWCRGCCRKPKRCEHWYLHKFRATYATELLRQGYDIVTVRKQLGHKPGSDATFRYLAPLHGTGLREKGIDQLFSAVG